MLTNFRPTNAGLWSVIASALLAILQPTAASSADDRLEPCRVIFPEYENRLESISHAMMPGKVELWVRVIPSFRPEWSVGVSTDKGRYFVTHVVFQESLWSRSVIRTGPNTGSHDFAKPHVETTVATANISGKLYEALRSEWARSIAAIHLSKAAGVDGVTFEFLSAGRCGKAWTPDPEARNGRHVELAKALARLADSKGEALLSAAADVERVLRSSQ